MGAITKNLSELMHDAINTADSFLGAAVIRIDREFGEGYAAAHPELVAAFMQAAAIECGAVTLAKVIGEAIESRGDGLE